MRRLRTVVLFAGCMAGFASAQGIEDLLVFGARTGNDTRRVSRGGEVLQTSPSAPSRSIRGVARAPDGKVWVVNWIQSTLTVLNRDLSLYKDLTGLPGTPYGVAFSRMDGQGGYRAYVTLSNVAQVLVFDQTATQVGQPIALTGAGGQALGVAVDRIGNVWVGIRANAAPGQVFKLAFPTLQVQGPFAMVTQASLGGQVYCSSQLKVYSFGDRSNEVHEFDVNGKHLQALATIPGNGSLADAAIDVTDTMWISDFSNGSIHEVDTIQLKLLNSYKHTRLTAGHAIALDGDGALWVVSRASPVATAFKFDRKGQLETTANAGNYTQELNDFTGYAQAHIVEPGADNDGDGETNGDELKNGTNPFEAQSSSAVSMRILGPQFVGQTFEVRLDRLTTLPAPFLLFLGARAKAPIAAPGVFKGLLHVDLATVLPVVAGIVSPAQPFTLKVPVPNDTNLAGLAVMMQAVLQDATSKPTLRMSDPEPFVIQR